MGPGQNNPDRSEDPWGRAAKAARMAVPDRATCPTLSGNPGKATGGANDERKPRDATGMPGVGLTEAPSGKAPSERPALEPYWGKLAVRNLRGDDGNVGIIRSPVRAIVLPDRGRAPRGGRRLVGGSLTLFRERCTRGCPYMRGRPSASSSPYASPSPSPETSRLTHLAAPFSRDRNGRRQGATVMNWDSPRGRGRGRIRGRERERERRRLFK